MFLQRKNCRDIILFCRSTEFVSVDFNGRSVLLRPFFAFKREDNRSELKYCYMRQKMLYIKFYSKENEIIFLLYTLKSKSSNIKYIMTN